MDRAHEEDATTAVARPSVTRRCLLMSGLVTTMLSGFAPITTWARKKKKHLNKPLGFDVWAGSWDTTLSNGVKGLATFSKYNTALFGFTGTYSNTVGSGTFECVVDGEQGTSLHCEYDQQSDGTSGGFSIVLTDKNHWFGSYFTDSEGSGTWGGVRR